MAPLEKIAGGPASYFRFVFLPFLADFVGFFFAAMIKKIKNRI